MSCSLCACARAKTKGRGAEKPSQCPHSSNNAVRRTEAPEERQSSGPMARCPLTKKRCRTLSVPSSRLDPPHRIMHYTARSFVCAVVLRPAAVSIAETEVLRV